MIKSLVTPLIFLIVGLVYLQMSTVRYDNRMYEEITRMTEALQTGGMPSSQVQPLRSCLLFIKNLTNSYVHQVGFGLVMLMWLGFMFCKKGCGNSKEDDVGKNI